MKAVILIVDSSMNEGAKEVRELNSSQNIIPDCGVSVDGTWQRRGFSSLSGCVTAISIDRGKVLDFEIMSQYCTTLEKGSTSSKQKGQHICSNRKLSEGSTEPVGVYRIFERSRSVRMLRYMSCYGDGDCKGFETVKDMYGK